MSKVIEGDCLKVLKSLDAESVNCCVTSPPYWGLRDYGNSQQIGLEETPDEYTSKLLAVFQEVKRVLQPDGTLWLNLGDSYAGGGGGNYGNGLSVQSHKTHPTKGLNKPDVNRAKDRSVPKWSYPNHKATGDIKVKDLVGIPWMVAFALRADGWYLRQDIIWHKPNPMPESVEDRCTKAHEYIFLLSKSQKYYYDIDAIRERQKPESLERMKTGWAGNKKRDWPGQAQNNFDRYMGKTAEEIANMKGANKRSVWSITTNSYTEAHFATFPEDLIKPCVLAGCVEKGIVLDPFFGAGTTGVVCKTYNREYIGIELNPQYIKIAEQRLAQIQVPFL